MKNRNTLKAIAAGSVIALAAIGPINAQEVANAKGDAIDLPSVFVTGDLWQTERGKTTASISLLDRKELESPERGHFDDLSAYLPNLTTTGGTARSRYIQIRGIGENSQFEGETPDSAVAFLIDDMDFTGLGSAGSLFDVKQVEVLRGPQAGAFGANAAGGLIRIVSAEPTPYWTGTAQTSMGEDSMYGGEIAIGGPLSENDPERLTMRFALKSQQSDGFYRNEFLGRDDTNERNETAARFKLRLKEDRYQWDGALLYVDMNDGYDQFSMGNDALRSFSNEPGRDEEESLGVSLKGQFDTGEGIRVTSKTSAMKTDSFYSYDADWTDASYAGYLSTLRDREVFNQEIRIDSDSSNLSRWTVGLYYQNLREDSDVHYRDGDPSQGEFSFGQADVDSIYETETIAAFGQMAFELNEGTRLIAGLRYEIHEVDFDSVSNELGYYQGFLYDGKNGNNDDVFGGKLTLQHNLNTGVMAFASIARGYKAGGANSGTFTSPEYPSEYGEETLWNLEAGVKGSWVDNRLTGQLTAFCLSRDDAQLRDSVGAGGFFRYLTVNGEDATHLGAEAELQWQLSEDWRIEAGIGFLNAERDSYTDPGGLVPERELANAPSYNYNFRLNYSAESGVFGSIALAGRDAYFESNSHLQQRDAVATVNASAGYQFENWRISVWSKNLLDEKYASRVFFFDNGDGERRYEALANPRQIGATLSYEF
ncbi:TonB-dependent receptor [Candidatus Pelagisphaera phototrophica]|uniref:TonB-dependent receptor n=1 Tax=Candidatus Pelagisphaera phototrophica TaxID=2684113 RepID=UPI0019DE7D38|nr:TonB-dependent receptor [Candidatus Pelagisphaera phototrophica]QXD33143.1 TonB-dependent receptor [Candidatus Pelagisphaera phototrophica]